MFRGVFGRALRAAGCARGRGGCEMDCERPRECSYARLFDPWVPEPVPHPFLRGQTRAPQPLLPIFPVPGRAVLRDGESIFIGLRILGPLKNGELERIFAALEQMADFDFGHEGGRLTFVDAQLEGRRETPIEMGAEVSGVDQIEVVFETPTWIEHRGELLLNMSFQVLFRAIYRRLCILCALYGHTDENESVQFGRLDESSKVIATLATDLNVLEWNRRSIARDSEHPLRGLLGRVVFAGTGLGAFLPFMRLAEKTHIGKSTSHGLGRIRVVVE